MDHSTRISQAVETVVNTVRMVEATKVPAVIYVDRFGKISYAAKNSMRARSVDSNQVLFTIDPKHYLVRKLVKEGESSLRANLESNRTKYGRILHAAV